MGVECPTPPVENALVRNWALMLSGVSGIAVLGMLTGCGHRANDSTVKPPGTQDTSTHAASTFSVDGRDFDCGVSGYVRLDTTLFYPGPSAGFVLDGVRLPTHYPHNDRYELDPAQAPQFPCSDGQSHRLQLETGHPNPSTHDTGCQIGLRPATQTQSGKNPPQPPGYNPPEGTCDITWED